MTGSPEAPEAIERAVRGFIVERFLFGREDVTITSDLRLVEEHVIDSAGVLELVYFLEETFGIHVEDGEVVPDNLDTVGRIVDFIRRKRGG